MKPAPTQSGSADSMNMPLELISRVLPRRTRRAPFDLEIGAKRVARRPAALQPSRDDPQCSSTRRTPCQGFQCEPPARCRRLELSSRQHTSKHGSGDMSDEMRLSFRAWRSNRSCFRPALWTPCNDDPVTRVRVPFAAERVTACWVALFELSRRRWISACKYLRRLSETMPGAASSRRSETVSSGR